eukprot:Nk52_evm13s236 gene=Nk52_evmTU13s236
MDSAESTNVDICKAIVDKERELEGVIALKESSAQLAKDFQLMQREVEKLTEICSNSAKIMKNWKNVFETMKAVAGTGKIGDASSSLSDKTLLVKVQSQE